MIDQKYGPLTGREWLDVMRCLHLQDNYGELIPFSAKLEEYFRIDHDMIMAWLAEDALDQQAADERRQSSDVFGQMRRLID